MIYRQYKKRIFKYHLKDETERFKDVLLKIEPLHWLGVFIEVKAMLIVFDSNIDEFKGCKKYNKSNKNIMISSAFDWLANEKRADIELVIDYLKYEEKEYVNSISLALFQLPFEYPSEEQQLPF